jgi:Arc/MetJ-type ribon-helix-helix transcriptional regulator
MDKPVQPKPVVVTLRPEDAFDLGERVARGEFSSLDEAVAAELADLNYRRAVEIMGGGDKLEALVTRLEAENDPSAPAEAEGFFAELRAGLKQRLDASRG